jgi:hypothetical protein
VLVVEHHEETPMNKRSLIAFAAAATLALPAASTAQAPAGASDALRALHLRSEGMNRMYVENPPVPPGACALTVGRRTRVVHP